MSASEHYIIVVSSGKQGVRVYVCPCTKDLVGKFWDLWKGRQASSGQGKPSS